MRVPVNFESEKGVGICSGTYVGQSQRMIGGDRCRRLWNPRSASSQASNADMQTQFSTPIPGADFGESPYFLSQDILIDKTSVKEDQ